MPKPSPSRRGLLAAVAVLALFCTGSCSFKGGATQRELMLIAGGWFAGIQERNWDLLARYDASAPDAKSAEFAAYRAKVDALLDKYEAEKLQGTWEPDPQGYTVIKASLIGANPGTYWGAPGREGTVDEPVLIVQASFAYEELGDQHLPPGTKVYVQGFPVGRVYRMEIGGDDKGKQVDVLDSLRIKVHMKRVGSEATPEGKNFRYKVTRAELVDGSAKHRLVKWAS